MPPPSSSSSQSPVDLPDEIWEQIITKCSSSSSSLSSLSLVSTRFLSLTNPFLNSLSITSPTTHFLNSFLRRFPNLTHISIISDTIDLNPNLILRQIGDFGTLIEVLDLSNLARVPIEGIRGLPTRVLDRIRVLKMRGLEMLGDGDLGFVVQMMPNLEEIDLSDPRDGEGDGIGGCGVTDEGVINMAERLTRLRKVSLSGNYLVSDRGIEAVCQNCGDLEEIMVDNCNFVTEDGICRVLRECGKLRKVSLHGMGLVGGSSRLNDAIGSGKDVEVIEFSYMGVSDGLLFDIAKAGIPLRKLTLFHCQLFTFPGIFYLLRTYQCLEYLALEGVYFINDQCMIDLSRFLRNAKTIKLNFCSRLSDSTLFTLVKNCPSLCSLEMEKTDLGKEDFSVSNARNLNIRSLNVSGNKGLTNECLEEIASACPNLEVLDLSNCVAVSRKGVGNTLRRCCKMRHLLISGCVLVKSLGVNVDLPKLEVLRASGAGLTDEGLSMLGKRCSRVMTLDLSCCNAITSSGVEEAVGNMSRLRDLNLSWCRYVGRDTIIKLVFSRRSLRKIVPPNGIVYSEKEKSFFWEHGCYICDG